MHASKALRDVCSFVLICRHSRMDDWHFQRCWTYPQSATRSHRAVQLTSPSLTTDPSSPTAPLTGQTQNTGNTYQVLIEETRAIKPLKNPEEMVSQETNYTLV